MAKRPTCWAEPLGRCGGPLTREHFFSDNLLGDKVTVNAPFLGGTGPRDVGKGSLVARCLCRDHHRRLSPCDEEAKRFSEAAAWLFSKWREGDGPKRRFAIIGHLLGRWMAKAACTHAWIMKRSIPPEFIRYAFSERDDPDIGIFLCAQEGMNLKADHGHYGMRWVRTSLTKAQPAVCFLFDGILAVITTGPSIEADTGVRMAFGIPQSSGRLLLPRPKRLQSTGNVGGYPGAPVITRGAIEIAW
jgi:hypothetical protein